MVEQGSGSAKAAGQGRGKAHDERRNLCGPLLLLKVSAQGFGALGGVSNQGDLAPPALVLHGHYGWRTHVG